MQPQEPKPSRRSWIQPSKEKGYLLGPWITVHVAMIAIAGGMLAVALNRANSNAAMLLAGSALAGVIGCLATVLIIHFSKHEGGRVLKLPLALAVIQVIALIVGLVKLF